ncbi:MAG TPA: hypothetical protein VJ718_07200 [Candidatus Binataceae bacterium]|nr:hypothetical protein [Candidatus Binataceae bacterium]
MMKSLIFERLHRTGCVAIYDDPADLLKRYDASPAAPDSVG